jgi:sporulation integral membrane protein YtvI
MLTNQDKNKLHHLINFAYASVIIFLIYLAFRYVFGLISPFIIAFIAASLIEPIVRSLNEKAKFPRALASSLCIVILLGIIAAISLLISTFILKEGKNLVANIPHYLQLLTREIESDVGLFSKLPKDLTQTVSKYIADFNYGSLFTGSIGSVLFKYAGSVVEIIPNAMIFLVVTLASSIFMSIGFPKVKNFILIQFKPKHQELIFDIKKSFIDTVWKYVRSYSILMATTFGELLFFFLLFGFKPALPLAFLIAFVDFLPVLGVGTVLIPWALFSLLTGAPWRALILICIYVVITIIRQILEPKIVGDQVGMPPILTLFCIWIGLKLFGFLGMFIVPITAVILKNLQDSGKIKLWNTTKGEKHGT